jgi:hypothetical protein
MNFVISPSSKLKIAWEVFMVLLAIWLSIVLPLTISIKPEFTQGAPFKIFMMTADLAYFISILISLRTATFNILTGEEIILPS